VARDHAIDELNESCPAGRCPASRRDELMSTRDRAVVLGPVSVAFFALSAAATGFGAYWLVTGARSRVALAPSGISFSEAF
jgi:hypothetical protein